MTDFEPPQPFGQGICFVVKPTSQLLSHVHAQIAQRYRIVEQPQSTVSRNARRTTTRRSPSLQQQRQRIAKVCRVFPGAIVCSLLRSDLPKLAEPREYVALEKTDGVRYLLLLTTLHQNPYAVMIDRKMQMRVVNLDFPKELYERDVLFDGELAQNRENGLYTYLVFDLIYAQNRADSKYELNHTTPYTIRMKLAQELVQTYWKKDLAIEADYNAYGDTGSAKVRANVKNTFAIKVKRFVPCEKFMEVFRSVFEDGVWRHNGYDIDGFIFVRARQKIEAMRNLQQFKYKPADKQTIDVQLIPQDCNTALCVDSAYNLLGKNAQNQPELLSPLNLCERNRLFLQQNLPTLQQFVSRRENYVVECGWDAVLQCWVLLQHRTDKSTPNAMHTIRKTKQNIDENITLQELEDLFQSQQRQRTFANRPFATQMQNLPTFATPSSGAAMPAHQHSLPSFFTEEFCNDGCTCTYCASQKYDPETNWQTEPIVNADAVNLLEMSHSQTDQLSQKLSALSDMLLQQSQR